MNRHSISFTLNSVLDLSRIDIDWSLTDSSCVWLERIFIALEVVFFVIFFELAFHLRHLRILYDIHNIFDDWHTSNNGPQLNELKRNSIGSSNKTQMCWEAQEFRKTFDPFENFKNCKRHGPTISNILFVVE